MATHGRRLISLIKAKHGRRPISLYLSMFSYIKMETGSAVIILIFLIGICYLLYDSIPSKYTKLEECFGGFMNRSLVRFEY